MQKGLEMGVEKINTVLFMDASAAEILHRVD